MASLLQYAVHAVRAPMNAVAFHLRHALPVRPGAPKLPHEDKAEAFAYLDGRRRAVCEAQAATLSAAYGVGPLEANSPKVTWRESLALIDGLRRLVPEEALAAWGDGVRALDVGAGDWHYVFGLERFLRHHGAATPRAVELTGIELDGLVRCRDLRTRAEHARARAAQTGNPGVAYQVGDVTRTDHRGLDLVAMFYPFVTAYAFLAWGLPVYHYKPVRVLQRAVDALRPGGLLVTFHQTLEERARLLDLAASMPLREEGRCGLATDLVHYWEDTGERCGLLLRRVADA